MAVHQLDETPIRAPLRLVPTVDDVEAVAERFAPVPQRVVAPPDEEAEARKVAILVQATGTLTALAKIVSARFILLLGIVGAFVMALFVVMHPSTPALIALGLYACVVGGLIALESGLLAKLRE